MLKISLPTSKITSLCQFWRLSLQFDVNSSSWTPLYSSLVIYEDFAQFKRKIKETNSIFSSTMLLVTNGYRLFASESETALPIESNIASQLILTTTVSQCRFDVISRLPIMKTTSCFYQDVWNGCAKRRGKPGWVAMWSFRSYLEDRRGRFACLRSAS